MSERVLSPLPLWVRAVDAVSVAALAMGLWVLVTGGFRESTPWGRLSITSAARPIALGLVLVLLRHAIRATPSVLFRVRRGLAAWAREIDAPVVWPIFAVSRIGVLVVAFLAIAMFGYPSNAPPWRIYDNDLLNIPARWDTGWYLGIAHGGYAWNPGQSGQHNIAFFPAYPLLIRLAAPFLARASVWAGVAISLAAFFFALIYLLCLARTRLDPDAALTSLALLAAYPFALFFSAAYTEGLFLLTLVAAWYHFERGALGRAAAWGFVAGLTRPNGCLLSVPLAILALRDWPMPAGTAARRLAAAAMPGVGLLVFCAYIYSLTGNPLQWAAAHAAYGRAYSPAALLSEPLEHMQKFGVYDYFFMQPFKVLDFLAAVLALGSVWPVYRRFGAALAAMILVNVAVPIVMGGALSMGRITCVLFPVFFWLAAAIPPRQRGSCLIAFAMLQALCAAAFFTWRPMF
jgi:hypothetical protein